MKHVIGIYVCTALEVYKCSNKCIHVHGVHCVCVCVTVCVWLLFIELYPEVKAGEGGGRDGGGREGVEGRVWSDQRKKSQPPSRLLHL